MAGQSFLRKTLEGILSPTELHSVSTGMDIVGDIAVIKIPKSAESKSKTIGEKVLQDIKNVNTVLDQKTPVSGEFRTRELQLLAGEDKTVTIHKESGCLFKLDLATTYFSPRLSYERIRIASQVSEGEVVVNMFGGAAPFSIIIAKKQPHCQIFNIDINPNAHRWAEENIKINKVGDQVQSILGNAKEVIETSLIGVADRVLMPLPETSLEYLDATLQTLKHNQGIFHFYINIHLDKDEDGIEKTMNLLKKRLNVDIKMISGRIVREVGPRWSQVVVDIKIS